MKLVLWVSPVLLHAMSWLIAWCSYCSSILRSEDLIFINVTKFNHSLFVNTIIAYTSICPSLLASYSQLLHNLVHCAVYVLCCVNGFIYWSSLAFTGLLLLHGTIVSFNFCRLSIGWSPPLALPHPWINFIFFSVLLFLSDFCWRWVLLP